MQEAKPKLPLGSGVNWLVLGVRDLLRLLAQDFFWKPGRLCEGVHLQ